MTVISIIDPKESLKEEAINSMAWRPGMIRTEGYTRDAATGRSLMVTVRVVPVNGGVTVAVLHRMCRENGKLRWKSR